MSVRASLARWFGRGADGAGRPAKVRVHVLIKGRIGEGWHDVDRTLAVPAGTTLAELIELAQQEGVLLCDAIENSPDLRHTLKWNGDRCPIHDHALRTIIDGDSLYLLAPVAGG